MLLIDDDLVVEVGRAGRRRRRWQLRTEQLLAGGLVLGIELTLHHVAGCAGWQVLRCDKGLLLLLIASVDDVVAISPAVHQPCLRVVHHHLAGGTGVRVQARPALVLAVAGVRAARHVLVARLLLVDLVEVLDIVEHLRHQLLILPCRLLLPIRKEMNNIR